MAAFRRRAWRGAAQLLSLLWLAVPAGARAAQLPLSAYDQNTGLASLSVTRMLQDRAGFVWAGTEKGLYRFDGVAFTPVGSEQGFQTSEVVGMVEDGAGRLWVGSRMGLQVSEHGRFGWVRPSVRPLLLDRGQALAPLADGGMLAVSGHRLLALARDAKGDWRASQPFAAAQLRQFPGLARIGAVLARDDGVWFGCGEELCHLRGGRLQRYGPAQGVPADTWLGLLGSRDGGLWARGTRAIRYLAAGADSFAARDIPSGRAAVAASSLDLIEDGEGRVLTRTGSGLARWNGGHWQLFGTDEGLPRAGVSSLALDRDGSLWLGTFGRGILHWNVYDAVENWTAAQGLSGSLVWSVARGGDGSLWIADEWGGSVVPRGGRRARPWPLAAASPLQARQVLPMADGSVWCVLFDGRVLRYRPASGRTERVAALPFFARGAYRDRAGRLWAYTLGGLYAVDAATGKVERVAAIPLATMCSDVAEDGAGRLWAACSAGLFRYAAGRWSRVRVAPEDSDGGYENVAVTPDGGLWLSTLQPGLLRGRVGGADSVAMAAVDDALLAATRFYFLRTDRQGRLWAGGGNGVDVYDGGRWTRITTHDGLLWDECDHGAFYADGDGSVWIGSPIGLSHLVRPQQLLAPRRLRPLLLWARYGGRELAAGATVPQVAAGTLTLRLAVLGNSAGNPVHFRYRLVGADRDWVETTVRELRYASLPSGHYRFELRVLDDNRRSLSVPLTLVFAVEPRWWRAGWAAAVAAVLLALAMAMLVWRWRMRMLVGHARRLERMVAERTAELERDKRELERTRELLHRQATRDSLTGLLNREAALQVLSAALQRHRTHGGAGLAVGLLDLDHFKQINDRHGHLVGDAVLRHVAACLSAGLREGELLGRYGGEEWLLALPDATRAQAEARAGELARRVVAYRDQDLEIAVTLSIGLAWLAPEDEASAEQLLRRADAMLYTAKRDGRDRTLMEPG